MALGEDIAARFHGQTDARQARDGFVYRFQKGALPNDMPELTLNSSGVGMPIANLLKEAGLTKSTSESLRMIRQSAVRVDGEKVPNEKASLAPGAVYVIQVGKLQCARITLK